MTFFSKITISFYNNYYLVIHFKIRKNRIFFTPKVRFFLRFINPIKIILNPRENSRLGQCVIVGYNRFLTIYNIVQAISHWNSRLILNGLLTDCSILRKCNFSFESCGCSWNYIDVSTFTLLLLFLSILHTDRLLCLFKSIS